MYLTKIERKVAKKESYIDQFGMVDWDDTISFLTTELARLKFGQFDAIIKMIIFESLIPFCEGREYCDANQIARKLDIPRDLVEQGMIILLKDFRVKEIVTYSLGVDWTPGAMVRNSNAKHN